MANLLKTVGFKIEHSLKSVASSFAALFLSSILTPQLLFFKGSEAWNKIEPKTETTVTFATEAFVSNPVNW